MSTGIVSQMFQPGGGVVLIPFIRKVIGCLCLVTMTAFFCGVARIHMAILTVLSGGLIWSLNFFESEFEKMQRSRGPAPTDTDRTEAVKNSNEKTD